jgi:hypothetical protein
MDRSCLPPRDLREGCQNPRDRPNVSVDQLSRRFAKFRREHPAYTRIPDSFRAAVLAVMKRGVTRTKLCRTCGLSSRQLDHWQKSQHGESSPGDLDAARGVQILSVVDDEPTVFADAKDGHREQPLELRLGGWSICVRAVGR